MIRPRTRRDDVDVAVSLILKERNANKVMKDGNDGWIYISVLVMRRHIHQITMHFKLCIPTGPMVDFVSSVNGRHAREAKRNHGKLRLGDLDRGKDDSLPCD